MYKYIIIVFACFEYFQQCKNYAPVIELIF